MANAHPSGNCCKVPGHNVVVMVQANACYILHAGFPLTDRDLSTSFAVLSAHAPAQLDWAAHRGIDTLVLLMAGATLQASVAGMLQAGWPADMPV